MKKSFTGGPANKGLRYKLILAFSLMSIIPLLVCAYIINVYVFQGAYNHLNISIVTALAVIIALLGLIFARGLVDPVINIALQAKLIAGGQYDRKIDVARDDEIGNLGASINTMTQRIKTNLDELKSYGQRVREINVDVHKKVLALSSLLQLGDIISAGSIQLEPFLELAVEKAAMAIDSGFAMLYMAKAGDGDLIAKSSYNIDDEGLEKLIIKKGARTLLNTVLEDHSTLVLDRSAKPSKETESFLANYNLKNALCVPIYYGKKSLGLLLAGSKLDEFKFRNDDIDLVKVFAKQMTIAIEGDLMSKKAEELEIKDELTGLYNKNFIAARLEDEIKRAIFYQRPCSLAIFNIDNFKSLREVQGELAAEEIIKKVAKIIKDSSLPVGKVSRVGGDEFAMLLPEKNKKEATLIAEDIKARVEAANIMKDKKAAVTISGGISENPIDGATTDELMKKAAENMRRAKSLGRNRIIG